MTFSISKKDLVYSSIIIALIATLVVGLVAYRFNTSTSVVKAYQSEINGVETEPKEIDESANLPDGLGIPGNNLKHLNCDGQIEYGNLATSTTYNPDGIYRPDFMGAGSNFQDINGDSLVDYTYNYQNLYGSNSELGSLTKSCVYLNNGQGWDRAYICYARTVVNVSSGNIVESEYRGDCAGTPSGNDKE